LRRSQVCAEQVARQVNRMLITENIATHQTREQMYGKLDRPCKVESAPERAERCAMALTQEA
jgi:hypothetical protein